MDIFWKGAKHIDADGTVETKTFSGRIGALLSTNYKEVFFNLAKLDPDNEPGRLTLITRFGAKEIDKYLPKLLREIKKEGFNPVWSCDPMHGNTYTAETSHKTRNFNEILQEIQCFFEINWAEGTVPGGIHFELTGDNVTECTGGGRNIMDKHLEEKYLTNCDPRLNAEQSLEIAFQIAEMIRS
jgi:3-deoxy-7-phosphoheptulonate synthase